VAQASLARVDFLTPDPLPIVGTRAKVALPTGGGMPSRREKGRVSTKTVRRYIADGHLEAVRLGRKTLRIKVDSIDRFIDARPVGGWRRAG
jgi:excisionase family DNA binding protein